MPKFKRDSVEDAQRVFEQLLPDPHKRELIQSFLSEAIHYAHGLNDHNWNLNMDPNGEFIRFNTGHAYCVQIKEHEIMILCYRSTLIKDPSLPLMYHGYSGKTRKDNRDIHQVPDCLVRVPGSIGCILLDPWDEGHLKLLEESNKDFIREALTTTLLTSMQRAHSTGPIAYLNQTASHQLSNPLYALQDLNTLPSIQDFLKEEERELARARRRSRSSGRHRRLDNKKRSNEVLPQKTLVRQFVYKRNQDVVAEVLDRAGGRCERCKHEAPFLRDTTGEPYLEVHHKIRLADGGEDTVENAIALCPNCHRHAHYGESTYHEHSGQHPHQQTPESCPAA